MKTKSKMASRPAQRDSKLSNGRLSGEFCLPLNWTLPQVRDQIWEWDL
jgi:hypothetical protein